MRITAYTIMGSFQFLRNQMKKEFKRVGIVKTAEKYGYFMQVLGEAPYMNNMTIHQMKTVIEELNKLEDGIYNKEG